MKFVYLFNGRLPTEKAHGLQIAKMCEAFAMNDNQVTLLSTYRRNPIKEDIFSFYRIKRNFTYRKVAGIDISWIPSKTSYYIQTIVSALLLVLWAQIYRQKGVIFYARDYWTLFFLCVFGMRPVAEIHDYRFTEPRYLVRLILKKSCQVIVNSKGTQDEILKHYKILADKFLVAPNGVDVEFFDVHESKQEMRERLGFPIDAVIVSYMGRLQTLDMEKGILNLITAFQVVSSEVNRRMLLCVIGGPDEMARRYASQAGPNTIFTGQVKHEMIPGYMRAADILIIPFPNTKQFAVTASPIKIFEYMASGKLIISSDLPAIRTVLNETNAVFFNPGDVSDLAAKIKESIINSEMSNKLAKKARADAVQYSWINRAQKIIHFIHDYS